jgi:acetolactate synthase-1/3 small subunit
MQMTYIMNVEDGPGVLTRVSLVFRRRGVNLNSVATLRSERTDGVRMILTADVDITTARKIQAQLGKLDDVYDVELFAPEHGTLREFSMIKIACTEQQREQLFQVVETYQARVLQTASDWVLLEAAGSPDSIQQLTAVLQSFGVLESVCTGPVAIRQTAPTLQQSIHSGPVADATGNPAPLDNLV